MNWYLKVLTQYTDFSGRARRKEYWMFTLFHVIIIILLAFLGSIINETALIILIGLYILATLIPSLAVTIRRLHDTGKSGWYYLVSFIPYIGSIWLLVLTVGDSEVGNNKWGSNPKTGGDEIDMIGTE